MPGAHDLCSGRMSAGGGVEPRHLRVLVALAEEGTFTDAAIRLGTSQPAVSRSLASLEASVGVPLVLRSTRSMRLTPAGEACYPAAVSALRALDAVTDAAHGRARPLHVGYVWAAFGAHTSTVLRRWREEFPDVPLTVHRIDDRSAGLSTGAVDVAVRRDAVLDPGLHVEPIFDEGRVAAVPVGSPLAGRTSLTLTDLGGETVALVPSIGTTTLDLWPATERPSRVVELTNTDEWLVTIASGAAVGVTLESTPSQHAHPGVRFVPVSGLPRLTASLVWPRDAPHPAVPDLLALVRRCVREATP